MAELGMSDLEFSYYQRSMSEAVRLIGQEADLFPVHDVEKDINSDKDLVHESLRRIGILFESNPRPILKKYQWLIEDDELPYVAYIVPMDHDNIEFSVSDDMVIRIASRHGLQSERLFLVTNVRGTTIDPLMWICKLTPYRPKVSEFDDAYKTKAELNSRTDTGFIYLNRGRS